MPLAIANALLYQAEYDNDNPTRAASAVRAAGLYEQLDLPAGIAQAAALAAESACEVGHAATATVWAERAGSAIADARRRFAQPFDRADFSLSTAAATNRALHALASIDSACAHEIACDLIIDSNSIAIGELLRQAALPTDAASILADRDQIEALSDITRLGILNQLAAVTTTIDPIHPPARITFKSIALGNRSDLLIAFGPPTSGLEVPLGLAMGRDAPRFELRQLSDQSAETIDMLGHLHGDIDDLTLLWDPTAVGWVDSLAEELLPTDLAETIASGRVASVTLLVHSSLSHVPFEAFRFDGQWLGATVPLQRLAAPISARPNSLRGRLDRNGFADASLDTTPEQEAFGACNLRPTPAAFRDALGPDQLVWICAHGSRGAGFGRTLASASGERVLDAIDTLSHDLRRSTVVLESCWAGRHFGRTHTEALSPATAALMAGAAEVVAPTFPLPAHPACTGEITAALLRDIADGIPIAEAIRHARATYLDQAPRTIQFQIGTKTIPIPGDAPLLWAGLAAFISSPTSHSGQPSTGAGQVD